MSTTTQSSMTPTAQGHADISTRTREHRWWNRDGDGASLPHRPTDTLSA